MTLEYLNKRWRVRVDNECVSRWPLDEDDPESKVQTRHELCYTLATEAGEHIMPPKDAHALPLLKHLAEAHNVWLKARAFTTRDVKTLRDVAEYAVGGKPGDELSSIAVRLESLVEKPR